MIVNAVGVTYFNEDGSNRADIIMGLEGDEFVRLEREPQNEYDRNAIRVLVEVSEGEFKQIGYLPGNIASELSPQMRRGKVFNASILNCGEYMGHIYCKLLIDE